jgi:serine/threonine protein kinase
MAAACPHGDSTNRIAGVYAVTSSSGTKASMLGSGSFGAVFKGVDTRTGGRVAIKVESRKAKHPQLVYEHMVLKELGDLSADCVSEGLLKNPPGIPTVYYFGEYGEHCLGLVMELLGPPVSAGARVLPPATVTHIAVCTLLTLRFLHGAGFVHRDLKPENLLWRREAGRDPVYLIDFGLCKRVITADGTHIEARGDKALVGTPQYAALHAHEGEELSRRDDLESLAYVLVMLAKGSLPWQDVKEDEPNERYKAMGEAKESVRSKDLIEGIEPTLGAAIQQTLYAAYNTDFPDCPDYTALLRVWEPLTHAATGQ